MELDENDLSAYAPRPPFPQRLVKPKTSFNKKVFDTLQQVKINIPLLDAIKQIPSYVKFFKDLCTVKRRLNVKEKAFLTEQVSTMMEPYTPIKCKDPGCPTISITICKCQISRALLDLGASVNLISYTVYEQLGLGELKPTRSVLQMTDRSVKVPRGIIEDVLVQVDQFYFPVDFIVFDTHSVPNPSTQIPIILERPFLATSNAVINCRNGVMKLTFENMKTEMNVFECAKRPLEELDEFVEVDLVDVLTEEYIDAYALRDTLKYFESVHDDNSKISVTCTGTEVVSAITNWRPMFEPIELPSIKTVPSHIKDLIPERKPLPVELKYAFLGLGESFPVVISSALISFQEKALLDVIAKHRRAIGWSIADLKGINPLVCSHRINLEDDAKPVRQIQRILNPL